MKTVIEINNPDDLIEAINREDIVFESLTIHDLKFYEIGYDPRINWESTLVTCHLGVLGYLEGMFNKSRGYVQ